MCLTITGPLHGIISRPIVKGIIVIFIFSFSMFLRIGGCAKKQTCRSVNKPPKRPKEKKRIKNCKEERLLVTFQDKQNGYPTPFVKKKPTLSRVMMFGARVYLSTCNRTTKTLLWPKHVNLYNHWLI